MVRIASHDRVLEVVLHVSTIAGTEEKTFRTLVRAEMDVLDVVDICVSLQYANYMRMEKAMSYEHENGNVIFVSGFATWALTGSRKDTQETIDNTEIEHIVREVVPA